MIVLSGSAYEKKCEKIAAAFAHLEEASAGISNFLAYVDPAILPEDEPFVAKFCTHIDKARKLLETF
jgi:hypothetical protein